MRSDTFFISGYLFLLLHENECLTTFDWPFDFFFVFFILMVMIFVENYICSDLKISN